MSKKNEVANVELEHEIKNLIHDFEEFTSRRSDSAEFSSILENFEQLASSELPRVPPECSLDDAMAFFNDFQREWRLYLEQNAESAPIVNIWNIAHLGVDEVRNCRVLNWLLDPNCNASRSSPSMFSGCLPATFSHS